MEKIIQILFENGMEFQYLHDSEYHTIRSRDMKGVIHQNKEDGMFEFKRSGHRGGFIGQELGMVKYLLMHLEALARKGEK